MTDYLTTIDTNTICLDYIPQSICASKTGGIKETLANSRFFKRASDHP